jgi:outer membrane protein TolC
MNRVPLLVLASALTCSPLLAQGRTVTLAEAIRLAEQTQPGVVQARAGVTTAAAQRRNAWGAFLPSVTAGSATRSDSLRSLVTLGNTRLDLIQSRTDLATAEAGLARLVGEVGRVQAADDSSFHRMVAAVDTQALRSEAEARSPRIQSAVASARAASADIRAARSAYWPSLTLGANTGWNASRANDYTFFNQRQVSLQLSWNLFNRFDRELAITQREASYEFAQATAEDERRAVQAELTQRLAELDAARSKIEITQTSVVAATEDLRVQQERYRLGASTIVDVLTSQEALDQAEVNVVTARFDYLRARAQIEALIGRTL